MSPFRRLFRYVRPYRREFATGLACVIATTAIGMLAPLVFRRAVDDLTLGVTRQKLLFYGSLILAVGCVTGIFRFLMRRILIGASRHMEYDMRNEFFAHLQSLPQTYYQTHRTGDLMSRATNDLNAVRMMIGPAVMYSATTILGFIASLSMMLAIDPWLTLVSLVPLPFVSISVKYFGTAIHKRSEQIQAQLAEVSAITQEALSGVRVVRAYRQEAPEVERFKAASLEYLARSRRLITVQGFFFPSMSFFLGLGSLMVLWIGSRRVIDGHITVGEFVAFNLYLTMLSWPMIGFGWVTNMLQRGMASWERMLVVLDAPPVVSHDPGSGSPAGPLEITGAIEFRDLVFNYGQNRVLSHVTARIEAGQTVALVGPTGSGKSTLINLLARLHEPPRGAIFIDGVDIRDIPLSVLRSAIAFVPQEPFLFSDSLADNVAFGLDVKLAAGGGSVPGRPGPITPDRRMALVNQAAAVARLDKDVGDFPKGFDTMVGERGITLSGGQKQRTAIARAVITDPRILVLDDALSAVDTYTEEEILSRLRGVMRERTSIIVSHRVSTVRDADMILVLDDGRILERGTHDELVRRGGLYADLYKKQLLEEELAAS
jgi:ATP-binding cassette subfamily B protein